MGINDIYLSRLHHSMSLSQILAVKKRQLQGNDKRCVVSSLDRRNAALDERSQQTQPTTRDSVPLPHILFTHQLLMSRLPPTDDDSIGAPAAFPRYDLLIRSNYDSFIMNASL